MPVMYLDTHTPPLVTVGVGNLIDPIEAALELPFQWKNATPPRPATPSEIAAEWTHIKSLSSLSNHASSIWNTVTQLFLDDQAIDNLIYSRLDEDEAILLKRWPYMTFATWPADAQLGVFSMGWAMGPSFQFPLFEQACIKQDFSTAATQSHMADAHNPGLTPRNKANYQLFMNAAQVLKNTSGNLSPETLYYPRIL
ncbi:MAG TPA: hypothetical protein VGL53_04425 [Bryobacteraceae bacterium]|jgi:hypothetical protein